MSDPMDVGVTQVRDASGNVVEWDLAPKALIASNGTARRPYDAGREEAHGQPLEGEPVDAVISDETELLRVLGALGVPIEQVEAHYGSTFDAVRGTRTRRPR